MSKSTARNRQRRRRPAPVPVRARAAGTAEARSADWPALQRVYTLPGYVILPLRLFLGTTFVYAAWQKLTDPGFLQPGSGTYLGSQLLGFSRGSPIRPLLLHMVEHAQLIGVLTIIGELGIGLFVLLGLFTRAAALGGLLLNLVFFLSASWHTYPYFMGSDIVFVLAWLTLILSGPGGYALDAALWEPLSGRLSPMLQELTMGPLSGPESASAPLHAVTAEETTASTAPPTRSAVSRREALVAGLATLIVVALGLTPRGRVVGQAVSPSSSPVPGSTSSSPAASSGTKIGTANSVPVNSALQFTDPKTGDPGVVVHTGGSSFVAFDAVCTHAGCTVQYDSQYKLLVCPCHGGAFDPSHGAAVVAGPPPTPLAPIPIAVDGQGNIVVKS